MKKNRKTKRKRSRSRRGDHTVKSVRSRPKFNPGVLYLTRPSNSLYSTQFLNHLACKNVKPSGMREVSWLIVHSRVGNADAWSELNGVNGVLVNI